MAVEQINLAKQLEFFDPTNAPVVNIIGCGSVGSTIADLIARAGFPKIRLWDKDDVRSHNIVNSMLYSTDCGKLKVDVVEEMIHRINPACEVIKHNAWYNGEQLNGIVCLCPDKIDVRKQFFETNRFNMFVKAVLDFRTSLTSAQHFFCEWFNETEKESFWNSMNFNSDEVQVELTACGHTKGVAPTVRVICSYGVANLINFLKGKDHVKFIEADAFNFEVMAC